MVFNRYTLRRKEIFLLVELKDSFYLSKTFQDLGRIIKIADFFSYFKFFL